MSSTSSYTYETVYVLRPNTSDTDAEAIGQKIENVITKFQGNLKTKDNWGNRELSYTIDNEQHGKYSILVYTGKQGVVEEIERHFRISNDVIRFLTVAVEADYDYSKAKKQISQVEEEVKRAKEARKKGQSF